jgi:hypothetical protein
MGNVLALVVGSGIAAFGFLIMRDPTRLAWLDHGAEAFYQRTIARGPVDRFQYRMLGVFLSFFGLAVLSGVLSGILKIGDTVSDGFLALLWISFITGFVFGMIHSIYEVTQGRGKDVFFGALKMRRRFITLGPIDFDSATISQMQKEAKIFTVIYLVLIGVTFLVSIIVGASSATPAPS